MYGNVVDTIQHRDERTISNIELTAESQFQALIWRTATGYPAKRYVNALSWRASFKMADLYVRPELYFGFQIRF